MIIFFSLIAAPLMGYFGSWPIKMIANRIVRKLCLYGFALLPVICLATIGSANGCVLGKGGEQCMGFEFTFIAFIPAIILWTVSAVVGYAMSDVNYQRQL